MYHVQQPVVDLCRAIQSHKGDDVFTDVLEPWLNDHPEEAAWPAEFAARTEDDWTVADDVDLCRLYSLYRATTLLTLPFQDGREKGCDWPGPAVSSEGFLLFHEAIGIRPPESTPDFHPFFHEIVAVRQATDDAAPPRVVEERWPALMLGDLLFARAGCVVEAGRDHLVKEIAETSTLYWTYRRKGRPCDDQSHGWGGNSQWRTAHRRDYLRGGRYHFNVDGDQPLDSLAEGADDTPPAQRLEVLRHRCRVRLEKVSRWDLYPYKYTHAEAA